ncbi:MAG: hypothetical protein AAB575_02285 [Patescibacteria group bacterium]
MKFGDIYWIPLKYAPSRGIGKHWVVILFFDKIKNIIYYQTLASAIYKIFPSFGLFADGQCQSCSQFKEFVIYNQCKKTPKVFLDVDTVTFLNPSKYFFLTKETYISYAKRIEKDNYFDFTSKASSGKYQLVGSLSIVNARNTINAMSSSNQISIKERVEIIEFFRLTKVKP